MRLFKPKRDAPAADEAQPRRRSRIRRQNAPGTIIPGAANSGRGPRADGPRTIVPIVDAPAPDRPSWLKDDALRLAPTAPSGFALDVDAARDRLRREIPPVADDDR